jgi:hypothetical protein
VRTYDDESVAFPRRGRPPAAPRGYKATSDPFVFVPDYPTCQLRVITSRPSPCGRRTIKTTKCELGYPHNIKTCLACTERKP